MLLVLLLLSSLLVVFSADFCFGMFIIFIFRNECKLRNETKRIALTEQNNKTEDSRADGEEREEEQKEEEG